uniref:Uncharacterized protein n=1 Tax=Hyaloperonospora arabidopsidis (strain Emoy2) TaxID=559515 RepID=M4B3T3_HYAAE
MPAPGLSAPANVSFSPDSHLIAFLHAPGASRGRLSRQLYALDVASRSVSLLATAPNEGNTEGNLSLDEKLRRERQRQMGLGITSYAWNPSRLSPGLLYPLQGDIYLQAHVGAPLKLLFDKTSTGAIGGAIDPQFSPDGRYVAFVQDKEVYVISTQGSETTDEEDNDFLRWVHRTRRLSSQGPIAQSHALCAGYYGSRECWSDCDHQPANPHTSGGKRPRSRDDTGHDVQKHSRRRGNLAEGESHTPMSSPTPGTHATSLDIGIGHDNDVVSGVSPHGTGGSLAHRAASVEVGVPKEEHEKVLLELNGLCETLSKTQSALDASQARVQTLESGHIRMEAQLDLLIRMQQPMARPASAAQAPPISRGTDPDTA